MLRVEGLELLGANLAADKGAEALGVADGARRRLPEAARVGAGKVVEELAVEVEAKGGHRADVALARRLVVARGVDLHHHRLACHLLGERVEGRRDRHARAAAPRVEVDDDGQPGLVAVVAEHVLELGVRPHLRHVAGEEGGVGDGHALVEGAAAAHQPEELRRLEGDEDPDEDVGERPAFVFGLGPGLPPAAAGVVVVGAAVVVVAGCSTEGAARISAGASNSCRSTHAARRSGED